MAKKRSLETNGISDEQYYSIMENVAQQNYRNWELPNADIALVHSLNDNTYNYRGCYNKYPNSAANAIDHWTDEFKTVYHPTFSKESKYSGKKSQYNPKGITGGTWYGEYFLPSVDQYVERSKFKEGGIHIAPSKRGTLTAAATKHGMSPLAFAHKVMNNKDDYSSKMVKKANFAINFNK